MIDLLTHEKEQAEQIANRALAQLTDTIILGPLLSEDQIEYIWELVACRAVSMNGRWNVVANRAHNMKIKT